MLGPGEALRAGAQALDGEAIGWARAGARELGIDLVAGSISERVAGEAKLRNTSVHVGPGRRGARDLPQDPHVRRRGRRHRLPRVRARGSGRRRRCSRRSPTAPPAGMSICYDVRFPELYRVLTIAGARILLVPAAFTVPTTHDHWTTLLRARAIENQCFVVAANQIGEHAPGLRSGGRSMIVDPWGVVLAQAPDVQTVISADLDMARLEDIRRRLPALGRTAPRPIAFVRRRSSPDGDPQPPAGGREAAPDPRRRGARVRAPGVPHVPRLGHRRRGGRRLRPRLPLLPLEGRGARHAVPRALGRSCSRRSARSIATTRSRLARSSTRSPPSSSTPTATTRT